MLLRHAIYLLGLSVLLFSCKKEDTILPDQQKSIVSFLTGSHTPKLVAEENVDPSSTQPFYSIMGATVYRYISNYYDAARPTWKRITPTSVVTLTFRAYVFNSVAIDDKTLPYYTNDKSLEARLIATGLTPGAWPFAPLVVDMSDPHIINGLYLSLDGCREGDRVEAYMTFTEAFGDTNFSVIPKNSPVVYFYTVDKVE